MRRKKAEFEEKRKEKLSKGRCYAESGCVPEQDGVDIQNIHPLAKLLRDDLREVVMYKRTRTYVERHTLQARNEVWCVYVR